MVPRAWCPCRTPQRNRLLSKKQYCVPEVAKKLLTHEQSYWEIALWTDESKVELFGKNTWHYIWHKKRTSYRYENVITTVKYCWANIRTGASWFGLTACHYRVTSGWLPAKAQQKLSDGAGTLCSCSSDLQLQKVLVWSHGVLLRNPRGKFTL